MRQWTFSLVTLASLLVAFAPTAAAHEHVKVGNAYELTLGWQTEPPLVDQPNAVWLKIAELPFGSGDVAPGETYSFTFREAGTFAYHCHPHPWMMGNVTVVEADAGEHGDGHGDGHDAHGDDGHDGMAMPETHHVDIVDGDAEGEFRFVPENLEVRVGDTVVWTNKGSMAHVVKAGAHGEDDHGHDHGHAAQTLVTGAEKTLKVEVTIAGKSRTFDFRAVHGEPGVYVAGFIPTMPGVYAARITGDIHGVEVDVTRDLQTVETLQDAQFPEQTASSYELKKELDDALAKLSVLQAKAAAESERTVPLAEDTRGTPFAGPVALVGAALVAVGLLRRRG